MKQQAMNAPKMKKLLLLLDQHSPPQPPSPPPSTAIPTTTPTTSSLHRFLLLLSFLSFFSLLTTLLSSPPTTTHTSPSTTSLSSTPIPNHLLSTILHYVPTPSSMTSTDLNSISSSLHLRCPPCNLLIFGLPHESLLLLTLNLHPSSLTVFLHDQPHHLSLLDNTLHSFNFDTHFETYDISYSTRVSDLRNLLSTSRRLRRTTCRPVQDLLFSDCDPLALNDLPNHLYDVDWDVVLVDGPSGYSPESPGRAAAIFSASVLARSGKDPSKLVDVFVHDFDREVEKETSKEFLCHENLVSNTSTLAHFSLRRPPPTTTDFCSPTSTKNVTSGRTQGSSW